MKSILKSAVTAIVALPVAATIASAADLPNEVRAPELAPVVQASEYDWSGAYIGANLGLGFEGEFDNNFGANLNTGAGFLGGGVAGYNHQINKFVLGIEGDINYTSLEADSGTTDADLDFLGTITGRIGYTPIDRVLAYVEGGYAFGQIDVSVPGASDDSFASGFVVGGGAEYAITDHIISGIEYNYVDLGDQDFNVGLGNTDSDFSAHTVKFNLKYKF